MEILRALDQDATRLGEVFRRTQRGETPEQIRVALGLQNSTFVWNNLRTSKAILDGDLPTAPAVVLQTARTLRRFLRENSFSVEARVLLEERRSVTVLDLRSRKAAVSLKR